MGCTLKGNVYIDERGRPRDPVCKRFKYKCPDEIHCEYYQRQQKIIKRQKKR